MLCTRRTRAGGAGAGAQHEAVRVGDAGGVVQGAGVVGGAVHGVHSPPRPAVVQPGEVHAGEAGALGVRQPRAPHRVARHHRARVHPALFAHAARPPPKSRQGGTVCSPATGRRDGTSPKHTSGMNRAQVTCAHSTQVRVASPPGRGGWRGEGGGGRSRPPPPPPRVPPPPPPALPSFPPLGAADPVPLRWPAPPAGASPRFTVSGVSPLQCSPVPPPVLRTLADSPHPHLPPHPQPPRTRGAPQQPPAQSHT